MKAHLTEMIASIKTGWAAELSEFATPLMMADPWQRQYDDASKTSTEVSNLISEKLALESQGSSTAKVKAHLRRKSKASSHSVG
jgi:hypothetical protein